MKLDPNKIPNVDYVPIKIPDMQVPSLKDMKLPEITTLDDIIPTLDEISNELKEQTKLLSEILKELKK